MRARTVFNHCIHEDVVKNKTDDTRVASNCCSRLQPQNPITPPTSPSHPTITGEHQVRNRVAHNAHGDIAIGLVSVHRMTLRDASIAPTKVLRTRNDNVFVDQTKTPGHPYSTRRVTGHARKSVTGDTQQSVISSLSSSCLDSCREGVGVTSAR